MEIRKDKGSKKGKLMTKEINTNIVQRYLGQEVMKNKIV